MRVTSRSHIILVQVGILLLAACSTMNVNLPSVTESPTGERHPGKIIWRDLLTNDPAASQRFYGELFGWTFESVGTASNLESDSSYTLIRHDGKLIGGMIDTVALNGRDDISQWIVSMSVEDIDAGIKAVRTAGGQVVTPPTDLQARGRLAVVRDAQGAFISLLQTRDGDPLDSEPRINDFLWEELWTSDVEHATTFYTSLAGLSAEMVDLDPDVAGTQTYKVLKAGDTPRVGVMPNPLEGLDPVWVSYLRVGSPAAITSRVAELGGRVVVEATARSIGGEAAFVAGPSGAGIALQTWPLTGDR